MKIIDSPKNEWIKHLAQLNQKKHRDASDFILVEGAHLIEEARNAKILEQVLSTHEPCDVLISDRVSEKLSLTHSGSTQFGIVRKPSNDLSKDATRIMILDGVQDPGNVGTIIRSAYSFGFDGCLLTPDCADELNDKTIRSSQGAVFHLPIHRLTSKEIFEYLSSHQMTLAVTDVVKAQPLSAVKDVDKIAVVIGSEGKGVSEPFKQNAHCAIKIETSRFESLNAAVAAGIIAYTLRK
ncbi:hypothetical protein AOC36_03125 [Erysipelothrix larvae]|uniref:Uncharacterized protein n=1 Tax=Erysipelothrix larvae TaxID=1514105 RepID=A0A0X8GYZ1_9FIRM|nr:RNA methyltransferase [Erysipelothrix larvae]AMC93009.1 hypothetical protein AOC36_03125 [Erysipelothrix larvae]